MLVVVLCFVCYVCVESFDVRGLLSVGRRALFALCVLLRLMIRGGRCALCVVCCLLCFACCLLRDCCCVLCVLFVVCRLFCVVAWSS